MLVFICLCLCYAAFCAWLTVALSGGLNDDDEGGDE